MTTISDPPPFPLPLELILFRPQFDRLTTQATQAGLPLEAWILWRLRTEGGAALDEIGITLPPIFVEWWLRDPRMRVGRRYLAPYVFDLVGPVPDGWEDIIDDDPPAVL